MFLGQQGSPCRGPPHKLQRSSTGCVCVCVLTSNFRYYYHHIVIRIYPHLCIIAITLAAILSQCLV